MPTSPTLTRALPLLAAAATIALVAAGCGTSNADPARGRALFIQTCGSCHTLAQAATTGTQGPNLDDAFAAARAAGEDSDTFTGLVKAQVEFPRPSTNNPAVSMPAKLVEGQDLEDVAAYVGSVAGVKGIKPPTAPGGPGGQVFAQNGCGGCHTLKAAGSSGTTGPDLDKILPGKSAAEIMQSIIDPNAKLAPGYPPNVMPPNYGQVINKQDLKLLVDFLIKWAGKG